MLTVELSCDGVLCVLETEFGESESLSESAIVTFTANLFGATLKIKLYGLVNYLSLVFVKFQILSPKNRKFTLPKFNS